MDRLSKADLDYCEIAVDDERRRRAIADLRSRRRTLYRCALVAGVASVICGIANPVGAGFVLAITAIQLAFVFKFDSDIRLLTVIDRLREDGTITAPSGHGESVDEGVGTT